MADSIIEMLGQYSSASLQQMVRQRGNDIKGKNKDTMIQMLAATQDDADRIIMALANLTPLERLVLERIALAGGDTATEVVRRQLEREGKIATEQVREDYYYTSRRGSPWARGSDKFEDIIARLGVLGLVFTSQPIDSGGWVVELSWPGQRLRIPEAVLELVPRWDGSIEPTPDPQEIITANTEALLHDVYVFLSFADSSSIPLTTRGQIPKRTLVQIDASLKMPEGAAGARSEDDMSRASLLRAMLEDLGLLVPRAGMLALGDGAEDFLSKPSGERCRLLYQAYLHQMRWCELFQINGLPIKTRGSGRETPMAVTKARRTIVTAVSELPVGQWVSFAHMFERIKRQDYEFLLPRTWSSGYYSGYSYQPNPYAESNPLGWAFPSITSEEEGWDVVEAGFIVVVAEALQWLGIVDIGLSDGNLAAFRLTPDGAKLLRGEALISEPVASHVVVQPNFQVFAFQPIGEDILFKLDRLAERVVVDQVIEYRLTRESVYRAQRMGIDTKAILSFLEQVSTTPVPQNVRRTLEGWGALHERIVVRRGVSILHVVDEATLDALYGDAAIGQLLGRRLAPNVAVVPVANQKAVYEQLLAQELLPALSEGPEDWQGHVLTVEAAGRIVPRHRVPSVHVLRALRQFADEETDGTFRMTPASLRRAAKSGLDADGVMAMLRGWQSDPIPAEIEESVRRWARDWGRGALVQAVILQVQSPDVLVNLLADPEVGPHLDPLPGVDTVALVRGEKTAEVRAALEVRGMVLSDAIESRVMR